MIKPKYYKEYVKSIYKFDRKKKNCFGCYNSNGCELMKKLHEFDETHEYNDDTEKERIKMIEKYNSTECHYGAIVEKKLKDGRLFGVCEKSDKKVKTNLTSADLPRRFFRRFDDTHIDMSGITDIRYKWCKENHFMKDSMLYLKRNGEFKSSIEHQYDSVVWGYDVFEALKYIKKYSPDIDINFVTNQIKEQIEWLKENEHETWLGCVDEGAKKDFDTWFLKEVSEPN